MKTERGVNVVKKVRSTSKSDHAIRQRIAFLLIGVLCAALLASLVSPSDVMAEAKSSKTFTFVLNWLESYGTIESYVVAAKPGGLLDRLVTEKTKGRVKLDIKADLFTTGDALPSVANRLVDISMISTPHFSTSYPMLDYASVPGMADDLMEMEAITVDPRMVKLLNDTYRAIKVQYLSSMYSDANNGVLIKDEMVDTVAKFNGKKIRASGVVQKACLEKLGASALIIPSGELATALARGTVDGLAGAPTFIYAKGYMDIAKNLSFWPINSGFPIHLVMRADKFDEMPADLRKAFLEAFAEATKRSVFARYCQVAYAMKSLQAIGTKIAYPSAAELAKANKLLAPVKDDWVKACGPAGKEAIRVMEDVLKKYRAYK